MPLLVGASFFIGLFKYGNLFIGGGINMAYNVLKGKVEGLLISTAIKRLKAEKFLKTQSVQACSMILTLIHRAPL